MGNGSHDKHEQNEIKFKKKIEIYVFDGNRQ